MPHASRRPHAVRQVAFALTLATTLGVGLVAPRASAQPAWQPGPPMETARASFPLVALPSGDLLAAGGMSQGGIHGTTTAEVFDVHGAVGAWRPVARMAAGHRYPHHGRLLETGEVLVVGEEYDPLEPPIAELFTESTGAWDQPEGGPTISRFAAHLTLLADGRALYSGGYGGGVQTDTYPSAELYDPAARTWSTTGNMASPRFGHGAVLLDRGPDTGRVLVAGGSIRALDNALATCELYDPVTGTWLPAAPMATARLLFTMTTLPNGRVLAAGGLGDLSIAQTDNRAQAELYDPATGRWSPAAPMAIGRARHTATLLPDGRVLVTGGSRTYSGGPTSSVEIYDPRTDAWTAAPDLRSARQDHEAALLPGGAVLVAGGLGSNGAPLASTEILLLDGGLAPTPTPAAPSPSASPRPLPTGTPAPRWPVSACPQIDGRVPAAAIQAALNDPERIAGYGKRLDPAKPAGPANPRRLWLTLVVLGRPYDRLANGLVFKVGCP